MADEREAVDAAFDAARFQELGHRLVDSLAEHLRQAQRGAMPVLPWVEPDEQVRQWSAEFAGGADPLALLERVIAGSNHLQHPRYVGHQVTPALPLAALCHLVATFLNSATAVYEMGPVATAMERLCAGWMARQLGWSEAADGVFTSGGSLGNLTALLAARQARAGYDVWSEGEAGRPPLAVLVGAQAHYSVARALQILGLGRDGAVPVAVDDRFRLDPADLAPALRRAEAAGRQVFAVVASSCSTATGAFDPLEPVADFCELAGLWLHIDGAHGASAALCPTERHLLAGIERADSVVWDAHKMMLLPALCTAVLFRDGRRSFEAFAQEASYLLHRHDPSEEWYNLCGRTFECTKPMMALPLYVALATYGEGMFGSHVGSRFALGRQFGRLLAEAPDFELPVMPTANIVCFRYRPAGVSDLDGLQAEVRRRILAEGSFYLVQTRLPDGIYLRVTLIQPRTALADLEELLETVRRLAPKP
ncbi:MAG: pyridoxal-dependent decarboxylase [Armatimonadetes bacterium]|nr:pyridoxal-dependent decarboxylase [Armatimonadota bacterium]